MIVGRADSQNADDLLAVIKERLASSSYAVLDASGGNANVRRAIEAAVSAVGCAGPALLRRAKDGHAFVTDSGHWVLDAAFERIADPKSLAERLDGIACVVEHGLFIGLSHAHGGTGLAAAGYIASGVNSAIFRKSVHFLDNDQHFLDNRWG